MARGPVGPGNQFHSWFPTTTVRVYGVRVGNKTILGLALACYGAAFAMLLFGRRPARTEGAETAGQTGVDR